MEGVKFMFISSKWFSWIIILISFLIALYIMKYHYIPWFESITSNLNELN